jgi:branched-chain amino acid transport system ATP-binding protein
VSGPPPDDDVLLEIEGLQAGYGELTVLQGIDLSVRRGEVVAVLGPNGAGKSTLLLAIAGVLPLQADRLRLLDVTGRRSVHGRARAGLSFVPSERGLFEGLTVGENIRIRTRERNAMDRAVSYFPALADLVDRRAGLLSGGEQQMLALAGALVVRPRLLLIDEMSMGLAPTVVRSLLPVIRGVADHQGVGVVLVEQHAPAAVDVSDRVVVLNRGLVVHQAPSAQVRGNLDQLTDLYLTGASVVG